MAERTPPPPPPPQEELNQADLTSAQKGIVDHVLKHFADLDYKLPGAQDGKPQLTEEEKFWLSYECLLRYLRASKWNQATAIQRLDSTLKWRREFGLYDKVTTEYVEPEGATGKLVIFSYDVTGKVGFHMHPSRQNTEETPRQMAYTVFMIERCIDLMGSGVETIVILLDYADKADNPSMGRSKEFLNIMQSHYPERLGYSLMLNVPWLLNAFFKLVSPFIDPVTKKKMIFNPKAVQDGHFARDAITKGWGGDREFEYDHAVYWPALEKLCRERREQWMVKWRSLGGKVGIREWDYKGGSEIVAAK